ncbi:hypothetical protein [Sporohalobacter salinus]|uniref:hypothetical protein n=1 Tax=Sporohalobacter salinus TaxID=1494606 RepID=UPI00195FA379|nr:hypothetical protein [Sporohalobacter salinus]MBM7623686.1 hypothetical protein [Sporohalobacter salinus]
MFAKDNDSYFIRYQNTSINKEKKEEIKREIKSVNNISVTKLFFRLPNETRMRIAYEVLAGWLLKFLYREYKKIPLGYNLGVALINGKIEKNEEELWEEFLQWMSENYQEKVVNNLTTLLNLSGRAGGLLFPLEFLKYFGEALQKAFKKADTFSNERFIKDRNSREVLMGKIFDYLKKPENWKEIGNIRRDLKDGLENYLGKEGHSNTSGNLWNAVSTLVMVRMLLSAKENNWNKNEDIVENFFKEVKRKDLIEKYNKKKQVNEAYEKLYEHLSSFDKNGIMALSYFKLENLLIEKSNTPFNYQTNMITNKKSYKKRCCLVCGSNQAVIENAGKSLILNEAEITSYDYFNSGNSSICSTCVFTALLSPIYKTEQYQVVKLPINNFYDNLLLAEEMSDLSAQLGVLRITDSALLSILATKYLLVSVNNSNGSLPKKTQLYLLLSNYLTENLKKEEYLEAEIKVAKVTKNLKLHVSVLDILSMLPKGRNKIISKYYESQNSNLKIKTKEVVSLLERGKVYKALYRGLYPLYDDNNIVYFTDVFKSPYKLKDFDRKIKENANYLLSKIKGGKSKLQKQSPKEFYQDVQDLSDFLFEMLEGVIEEEVKNNNSNVSGIIRKYTDVILRDFPKLKLSNLQYMFAQRIDRVEKGRNNGRQSFVIGKKKAKKKIKELEDKILNDGYYNKYGGQSNYLWTEFIKEVNSRLLSKLLLNISIQGGKN